LGGADFSQRERRKNKKIPPMENTMGGKKKLFADLVS
jgi:hypothetical protein